MNSLFGNEICKGGCSFPPWAVLVVASVLFLMLLAIVVLSACLCRVCKRVKKLKLSEQGTSENTYEADVHYAELQNLPGSSRGQCDGGTSPDAQAVQNSDYATVAVLKDIPSEENVVSDQPKEDNGVTDREREDHIFVEAE